MKSFYIITLYLISSWGLFGQHAGLLDLPQVDQRKYVQSERQFQKIKTPLKTSKNEIQLTLNILFNGYKSYLSSQDLNSCTFYPSCSEYGLQAIQKRGLVMGMAKTFDRLSRCHGFSPELYDIDMKNKRQIDLP